MHSDEARHKDRQEDTQSKQANQDSSDNQEINTSVRVAAHWPRRCDRSTIYTNHNLLFAWDEATRYIDSFRSKKIHVQLMDSFLGSLIRNKNFLSVHMQRNVHKCICRTDKNLPKTIKYITNIDNRILLLTSKHIAFLMSLELDFVFTLSNDKPSVVLYYTSTQIEKSEWALQRSLETIWAETPAVGCTALP